MRSRSAARMYGAVRLSGTVPFRVLHLGVQGRDLPPCFVQRPH
jgi:hypothetical protein